MKPWGVRVSGLLVAAILILLVPALALGQSASTGSLTGTVTDPTGAVVPNVTVTVTSADTGQVRTAMTGADGSYRVPLLPPGGYRVKFEAAGFQATEVPSITITVTETGTLNQALTVGAQTQQVTVEANVETIQTASSTLGTVVGSEAVVNLPLSTRNYTNLLALSAGTNSAVNNASQLGKGFQNFAVNGAGVASNNFQMDGASIVNWSGSGSLQEQGSFGGIGIPSPDAIQEFKIQTSTYDAGYGRNPGANVNVVTRSGTNDYHGTAFEFFRNTVLNSNDFFNKRSQLSLNETNSAPVLNQNQFGGVLGGPIKKDKLFFFGSYQQTWQKNGLAAGGFQSGMQLPPIPTGNRGTCPANSTTLAACDAATQTFVSNLAAQVSPECGTPGSAQAAAQNPNNIAESLAGNSKSTYAASGFAQVACNGSNINPTAVQILQLKETNLVTTQNPLGYYLPSSNFSLTSTGAPAAVKQGYLTGFTISDPALDKEYQGVGNMDYVINSKNTLSTRYFYGFEPQTDPLSCGVVGTLCLLGAPVSQDFGNHEGVVKLTTIISNNMVNELRVSAQRNTILDSNGTPFTDNGANGVGITPVVPAINNLSGIVVTNEFNIGANYFASQHDVDDATQVADQLSWTRGKHTLRMGFESEHQHYYWVYPSFAIGQFTADTFADFLLGLPGGCGAASATCNGSVNSNIDSIAGATQRVSSTGLLHYYGSNALSSFVQDDIKISPRLTVNLGVRWEYDGIVYDQRGDAVDIWLSQINTVPIPPSFACTAAQSNQPSCAGAFTGFVAPSNYQLNATNPPIPAGVLKNVRRTPTRIPTPLDNFAPRLGFAWQPLSSNKLVLRGGAGYFFDRITNSAANVEQDPPYSITIGGLSAASNAASTLQVPFATTPLGWQARWVNFANGLTSAISTGGFDERFTTPLVYQYNLGVQYEFLPRWVLELGYVGSQGIHQNIALPVNGAPLASAATPLSCGYDGVAADCLTANTVSGGTSTAHAGAILRAPYLGFTNSKTEATSEGNFKFNSLQATVRKQVSRGLTLQAAYTLSKASITSFMGNPNAVAGQNPVLALYGPNTAYRPNRFTANYSWDLPFGHPDGLKGKLVTGWNLSGVTTLQGGTPLTFTQSTLGNIFGTPVASDALYSSTGSPATVGAAGSLYSKVVNGQYFNPCAFLGSGACTANPLPALPGGIYGDGRPYGNSGLGIILGPGQDNWDLTLRKTTVVGGLREGATLEFRAEFFNAFNHPNFANPNGATTTVSVTPGTFGQIVGSSVNPRLIQFGLKYAF